MKRKNKSKPSLDEAIGTMSDCEREQIRSVLRSILRYRGRIKFKNGNPDKKGYKHPLLAYAKIFEVCKTDDLNVGMNIIRSAASGQGTVDNDHNLEHALSLMEDLKPESTLEAMLVAQMVAVNDATTRAMSAACDPSNTFGVDHWLRISGRLQRTFLAQAETLQKLRGKGQQTVRVEHVTVTAGGQAIIGNIEHHQVKQGGGDDGIRGLPHVQCPPLTTLWSKDEGRDLVPAASHGREKAVQAARREE